MNIIPPRVLKSFYRKEPITGVIITMGAVNAVLGGVNAMGSLMILGLLASGSAIAYRWWMIQQAEAKFAANSNPLYLPAARSSITNLDADVPSRLNERRRDR